MQVLKKKKTLSSEKELLPALNKGQFLEPIFLVVWLVDVGGRTFIVNIYADLQKNHLVLQGIIRTKM